MHKAILIMLLAVVSSSAMAEWVSLGESGDKTLTNYADPATIRKSGNRVKMWSLYDFKTVQVRFRSVRLQIEYDCKEEEYRVFIQLTPLETWAEVRKS